MKDADEARGQHFSPRATSRTIDNAKSIAAQ